MTVALRVVSGPAAGTLIPIGNGLVVGRDAPAPGNLSGDQLISRRHAQLRPNGDGAAIIEDLGSSNPTEINGAPLTGSAHIRVGDRLLFGSTTVQLELDPVASNAAPYGAGPAPAANSTQVVRLPDQRNFASGASAGAVAAPAIATIGAPGAPVGSGPSGSSGPPPWQPPPGAGSSKGGGGKATVAVVGALVLIAAGGVGGYLIGHNKSKTSTSNPPVTTVSAPKEGACVAATPTGQSGEGHFRFNTSACENGTQVVTTFILPLHKGTSGGKPTYYVIMDTSNKAEAARLGINFSPRLGASRNNAGVEKVKVGADGTIDFPGTVDFKPVHMLKPGPNGFPPAVAQPGAVGDAQYSPLIQLPDGTVENAPQISNSTGTADKVVSMDLKAMKVVYRAQHGFYENKPVHYASFESTDPGVAAVEDVTYAPLLAKIPKAGDETNKSSRETLIAFVNGSSDPSDPLNQGLPFALKTGGVNATPLNLLHEVPQIANHDDVGCECYTPMWDVHFAEWTQFAIDAGDRTQYRDVNTVIDTLTKAIPPDQPHPLVTAPGGKPFASSGVIVNCPLVSIDIP